MTLRLCDSGGFDLVICYGVACTITPADPMSAIVVFLPTFVVWMTILLFVSAMLSRSGADAEAPEASRFDASPPT